jgi:hypothetical protein
MQWNASNREPPLILLFSIAYKLQDAKHKCTVGIVIHQRATIGTISCVIANVMDADIHTILDLGMFLFMRHGNVAPIEADLRYFGLSRVIGRNYLAMVIELNSVSSNLVVLFVGETMSDSLFGTVDGLDLASFAAKLLEMVKVAVIDGGNVVAAEDSNFEVDGFAQSVFLGDLGTGTNQVVQSLEDDAVGANVSCDTVSVAAVCNELARRCQVDTVHVSVSANVSVICHRHA